MIGGLSSAASILKDGLADAIFDLGDLPSVSDQVLAPLVAITGQMLGLFLSLKAGLRPDSPSPNGIINRVVQGVRIHPCVTES